MMWDLCRDLKAFYAKVGQLISIQGFVPEIIRSKLSRLQDDMPPLPGGVARRIIQEELHAAKAGSIEEVFKYLDLSSSLGCASIAQVHYGVLREHNIPVAVKVQQPDAKLLMASDLGNFRALAEILQKTELKFDLVGPVKELSKQLRSEFDFENEARSMNTVRDMLVGRVRGVRIPKSVMHLVTPRLLVMEFLEGTPLSRLNGKLGSKRMLRRFGKRAIKRISDAYGEMILINGFFQADPHPGNILVLNRQVDIGIIDFGQTKRLSENDRLSFAELVDAMALRDAPSVAAAMTALGVVVEDVPNGRGPNLPQRAQAVKGGKTAIVSGDNNAVAAVPQIALTTTPKWKPRFLSFLNPGGISVGDGHADHSNSSTATAVVTTSKSHLTAAEQLAYTMFDTAEVKGVSSNPFSDESALRTATVKTLPQDLFFLLRTLQIIRGICAATGNEDLSIANSWAPVARRALRSGKPVGRPVGGAR
jgi:aarF domain-containing kinase